MSEEEYKEYEAQMKLFAEAIAQIGLSAEQAAENIMKNMLYISEQIEEYYSRLSWYYYKSAGLPIYCLVFKMEYKARGSTNRVMIVNTNFCKIGYSFL